MNSTEFITSGIIEAYVMGLCTPQEKAEVETMRLQHTDVHEAIIRFETELEQQFTAQASETTPVLDNKILQTINELNAAPVIPIQQAVVKKINWLKPVAAAAILLLAGSTVLNLILYNKTQQQQTELALAEKKQNTQTANTLPAADFAVLTNKTITPVAMYGVGLHAICRCTMFWDKNTGKAYIMIHHLMTAPQGKNYQLWAMVNGRPVSVGIIDDKIRGRFIEVPSVPEGANGFSVTLENAGGSAAPTEDETYLVGRI
jgi:anti-sigma-K factor RskA